LIALAFLYHDVFLSASVEKDELIIRNDLNGAIDPAII
jgi:hypothetical protein